MSVPLDTIAARVRAETLVNRSRFVATLAPVADEDAAGEVVRAVRREFHDARHHGTAMVLGPDGQQQRSNDDGEPAGTTGAPMLAVLRGAELTDVIVVVTRYFGGTLLGAGGLVRAYGGAVTAALELTRRRIRRPVSRIDVEVSHTDAGRMDHRLRTWAEQQTHGVPVGVAAGRYTVEGAHFEVTVPPERREAFLALLDGGGIDHRREDRGTVVRAFDRGR